MFKTVHQFTHLGDDNQIIIEVDDFVVRDGSMKSDRHETFLSVLPVFPNSLEESVLTKKKQRTVG